MERIANIELSVSLETLEKTIKDELCAIENANIYSIGEFFLTPIEMPDEQKRIREIWHSIDPNIEVYSKEEEDFFRRYNIKESDFNSILYVEVDSRSIGAKFLYPFTAYIAESIWAKSKCDMMVWFDVHNDKNFHPFARYSSNSEMPKEVFREYFPKYECQPWKFPDLL